MRIIDLGQLAYRPAWAEQERIQRELRGVKAGQTVMLLVRSRAGGSRFVAVTPEAG